MKSSRSLVWSLAVVPLVMASIAVFSVAPGLHAGETMATPAPAPAPAPRPNPLAPLGRAIGNLAYGAGQWVASVAIGTPEELSKTAAGAVRGSTKAVHNTAAGAVKGAARYANDTKADNR